MSQRLGKNKRARENFERRECDCSYYPYVHSVNHMRTWERHQQRRALDHMFGTHEPVISARDLFLTDPLDTRDTLPHGNAEEAMQETGDLIREPEDLQPKPQHQGAGPSPTPRSTPFFDYAEPEVLEQNDLHLRDDSELDEEPSDEDEDLLGAMAQLGFVTMGPQERQQIYDPEDCEDIMLSEDESNDDIFGVDHARGSESEFHSAGVGDGDLITTESEEAPEGIYNNFDYKDSKSTCLSLFPLCVSTIMRLALCI